MSVALSVVIPTYGRDAVLVNTCRTLLHLKPAAHEILLVDQSEVHDAETQDVLEGWESEGVIRWIRLDQPSIARAMNTGLLRSQGDVVLFLDDDIVPDSKLFASHVEAHADDRAEVVAGRVIQPWDRPGAGKEPVKHKDFDFTAAKGMYTDQFMGGNVSMRREYALAVGGVDENFVRVAYRFERELADRFVAAGFRIWYEPGASIEHLKAPSGGTRTYGRRWLNPGHGVGEYYYLLRSSRVTGKVRAFSRRVVSAIANRHHAYRPWLVPMTLAVEVVAMGWAGLQYLRGPRLVERSTE